MLTISGPVAMSVTGVLYTIPALALFAFLIPFMGLGKPPAITALVLYSLLILVRNIAIGIREVPAELIEAADGMGYGRGRRLVRIELPLALPVIVAGIRITAVTQIGYVFLQNYFHGNFSKFIHLRATSARYGQGLKPRKSGFVSIPARLKSCLDTKPLTPKSNRQLRRSHRAAGQLRLVPRRKRQQRNVPRLLDGTGQTALMRSANTGQPPRHNLATLGHKPLQQTDIPVWNGVDLLSAELADLFAAEELAASARSAGSTGATSGTAARATGSTGRAFALWCWCAHFGRFYGFVRHFDSSLLFRGETLRG